jgi:hypothetical protein
MTNPYESEVDEPTAGWTGAHTFWAHCEKQKKAESPSQCSKSFFFSFGMGRVNRAHRSR